MTNSEIRRRNAAAALTGAFLLSAAVLGCHQVPQNRYADWAGYSAGEGYSVRDEEAVRQWHRAATGSDGNVVKEVRFDEIPPKTAEGKLSFMKKIFRRGDSDFTETAHWAPNSVSPFRDVPRPAATAEGLCYDGHLLPLEKLPDTGTCPGKTIPFTAERSDFTPPSRMEPRSAPSQEGLSAFTADPLDMNSVSTMEATLDPTPESVAITTAERLEPIDFTGAEVTKPVGLTRKSFQDFEEDEMIAPLSERPEGKIEWCDEETNDPENGEDDAAAAPNPAKSIRITSLVETAEKTPLDVTSWEMASDSPFPAPLPDLDDFPKPDLTAVSDDFPAPGETKTTEVTDWRSATLRAIELLQTEIDRKVKSGEICSSEEACLRLLLLSTGNIPGAAQKIAGANPALQKFWERECRGLGKLIDAQATASNDWTVTASAVDELRDGVDALKSGFPVVVRKSLFVKETSPFGYYEEIPAVFSPGQTIYAYYELDNVVCKPVDTGHEIAVFCRRELLDTSNHPVIETREKLCDGHSSSSLDDIVLNLSIELPKSLSTGGYTLKTTFLDKNGTAGVPVTRILKFSVK